MYSKTETGRSTTLHGGTLRIDPADIRVRRGQKARLTQVQQNRHTAYKNGYRKHKGRWG